MRTALAVLALVAAWQPAQAHDFWLRPATFQAASGQPVAVSFLIGHGREVEPWSLRWDRLHSFHSIGPDGASSDQQATVRPANRAIPAGAMVRLEGEGTHMLVTTSYHSMSTLPAAKFNDYLKLEGLTAISDARVAAGTTLQPGRELYSRRAKSLVQVGGLPSPQVTRPLGLTLEIVPQRNPYAPDGGTTLPVTVLFRGKPLAGALIDLTALDEGTEPRQAQRTSAAGTASFDIPRKGAWKISVVWGEPTLGRKDADFDTIFASLTFGYAPER